MPLDLAQVMRSIKALSNRSSDMANVVPIAVGGRRSKTRAALIDAGLRLFAERSVDAVTIDDLVQAANVAKGTFYNHFEDRDALLAALLEDITKAIEQLVIAANTGIKDPAQRVARAISVYLRYAHDYPTRSAVLARVDASISMSQNLASQGVAADVARGIASGRLVVPTTEVGVLFVTGVSRAGIAKVASIGNLMSSVALSQQMVSMVLRGLGIDRSEADQIASQATDEIVRLGTFAKTKPSHESH
jgi:AcrR family transcriptional regulator